MKSILISTIDKERLFSWLINLSAFEDVTIFLALQCGQCYVKYSVYKGMRDGELYVF